MSNATTVNKTKIENLRNTLLTEIVVEVGEHFDVFVDAEFIRNIKRSIDDITAEILKLSNEGLS